MSAIHIFLKGVIDYAGLFPPAQLPLRNAVENYAAYRNWIEKWMLGRFVCPQARLAEMLELMRALQDEHDSAWGLTLLPTGGEDAEGLRASLREDLREVDDRIAAAGVKAAADVLEVRLPADVLAPADPEAVREALHALLAVVADRPARQPTRVFLEVPFGERWREETRAAAEGIARAASAWTAAGQPPPGYKIRCGGTHAAAFPSVEQVAQAIAACRDLRLALKATAGLHHPIRHYNDLVEAKMHGFLNIFAAVMLAARHNLDPTRIGHVVADETGSNFRFAENGFSWFDLWIPNEEIEWMRAERAIAFGSCSFHEPVEDLQKLGLIPYPPMFG